MARYLHLIWYSFALELDGDITMISSLFHSPSCPSSFAEHILRDFFGIRMDLFGCFPYDSVINSLSIVQHWDIQGHPHSPSAVSLGGVGWQDSRDVVLSCWTLSSTPGSTKWLISYWDCDKYLRVVKLGFLNKGREMEREKNAVGRGMVCVEVCLWMKVLKHCTVWNWLLFWNQCTEKTEPHNSAFHLYSCCSKYFCKNQCREPTQQCKFCVIIEQRITVVAYWFPPSL